MEKLTETCTCDDIGEGPCPRHGRENALQGRVMMLEAILKEADDYLNTNNQTNIGHGSILHGKFAAGWRRFDAHEHDGKPCSAGCMGHQSHPCEKCGRQWPVRIKEKD